MLALVQVYYLWLLVKEEFSSAAGELVFIVSGSIVLFCVIYSVLVYYVVCLGPSPRDF